MIENESPTPSTDTVTDISTLRPGPVKRLYQWVESWAESRYAVPALAVVAFAESSFFLVPPDVLLMPLCLGKPKRAFRLAAVCTVASVLGGMFGYFIGAHFFEQLCRPLIDSSHGMQKWETFVTNSYQSNGALIVFIAGFSPIPYKLFTILGGFCRVNIIVFFVASLLSRGARFYIEGYLCKRYGAQSVEWIERNTKLIAWLGAVAAIALGIGWYLFKMK